MSTEIVLLSEHRFNTQRYDKYSGQMTIFTLLNALPIEAGLGNNLDTLRAENHPDKGGDHDIACAINEAIDMRKDLNPEWKEVKVVPTLPKVVYTHDKATPGNARHLPLVHPANEYRKLHREWTTAVTQPDGRDKRRGYIYKMYQKLIMMETIMRIPITPCPQIPYEVVEPDDFRR